MKKVSVNGSSRREFLQSAGCFAGALAAIGISKEALAAPVTIIDSDQTSADKTYPIPAADGVSIDRAAQVILVRSAGHVYAFALSCPHQNAAVKWVPQHNQFECTKHDSHYLADGLHVSGRATRNLDRLPIKKEGDTVRVDTAHVFQSDKDAAGWAAAAVSV
jgi:nitrite reductase/ring-hydroxylating ferredoxin subunit